MTAHRTPASAPWEEARQAAGRAGVTVRELETGQVHDAAALLMRMWGSGVVEAPMMVALRHAGAYVAGAFADDDLVGVCVAYFSQPLGHALHSHVAAVAPGLGRRGIGVAMKLHQRAWASDRGLAAITWTFDPLVARNAAFNIERLGVGIAEYLEDFYGQMPDSINAGAGSDRLMAKWDLTWPPAERTAPQGVTATVEVPADIEALRQSDPDRAAQWRIDVRESLGARIHEGWTVRAFTDNRYVLEAP